jgi:light-regulated signal transduction histidine kinase (bacteriophytochrome)
LNFSRLGRAELQKSQVDLNRLVAEVRQQFAFETQDRSIEWRVEPLPQVLGDGNLLKQVFANFLSNAIKYTRNRRQATITVGCEAGNSEEVVLFVRDNGVGFNMKHASKLFGVFQRLHNVKEFEGTGIGLANVQRIIQRHGGRVWVEAEEDQGAAFFCSLPR